MTRDAFPASEYANDYFIGDLTQKLNIDLSTISLPLRMLGLFLLFLSISVVRLWRRRRLLVRLEDYFQTRIVGSADSAKPPFDGARVFLEDSDTVAVEPFVAAIAP